jgi:ABC-type bacteriocin/lantibiotic exporter with double-glycine peptidase domain
MIFASLGISHDEATIAQHCGITPLGCTIQDLVGGAQSLGFSAAPLAVSSEPAAISALSNETPFVAMIDLAALANQLPIFQWHFVVPLRIEQNEVIFHDPADGADQRAKVDDFLTAWATAGYRGIRLWNP